jgi:choline kinase
MNLHYVENPIYDRTNTTYSLLLALKIMDTESYNVLVLEGDVFFEKTLMDKFVADPAVNKTVLASYSPPMEGSFAAIDGDGNVREWWHKSQQLQDFALNDKFKTVNLHCFSRTFVNSMLIPEIESQIRLSEGRAPLEYVMRAVLEKGAVIKAVMADGIKWWEIDDTSDLQLAEALFRQELT